MKKIIAFARSHYPFFWAAIVLLTGFLAMLGWWCFGTHCEEPGFFYYRAATYGDAIGLTLLVFACGRYCQQAMKDKQQEIEHDMIKHLPIVVAVIVGLFFFAWQVEWLVEADTNWTLVRRSEPISFLGIQMRNRFTGAGYWHAAFFVGAGALISYFFMRMLCVRTILSEEERSKKQLCRLFALASFSGCFYIAMISSDNINADNWLVIPAVCFGCMFFLSMIVFLLPFSGDRKKRKREVVAVFAGGITAVLLSLVIVV